MFFVCHVRQSSLGEPFEHEADGRQVDEGFRSVDLQLVVFAQALSTLPDYVG